MTALRVPGMLFLGSLSRRSPVPLTEKADKPLRTAVYVGMGAAYRFVRGEWERLPSYDYGFTIVQRFHEDGWESIKEIYRRHPDYDGRAGDRDQTLYFRVKTGPAEGSSRTLYVQSSWGQGRGTADTDLSNVVAEFSSDISWFAPFNAFRITQKFSYEEGRLRETVHLQEKRQPGKTVHEDRGRGGSLCASEKIAFTRDTSLFCVFLYHLPRTYK